MAYTNRTGRARDAAGFATIAYAVGVFAHVLSAPWVLAAFVPLGLATRWLRLAAERRHEAWRIVYTARRHHDAAAAAARDGMRNAPRHRPDV